MNNSSSNDNFPKTLSFFPFVSDGGVDNNDTSVMKRVTVRLLSKRARQVAPFSWTARREASASPIVERRALSPYHVDDYGRPRILSKAEIFIHDVARWTVIAVVIGYALAIALVVIHNSSALKPHEKINKPQVALQEVEP
jgi:hypothetical protein